MSNWLRGVPLWLGILVTSACGSVDDSGRAESSPSEPVSSGMVTRWGEATTHLQLELTDDGTARVSLGLSRREGLETFWSIATTKDGTGTGFFYADVHREKKECRVARARVAHVAELRDARRLDFTTESVGPVSVGEVVVVEHAPTRRYLALVLDAIEPTDPRTAGAGPYAYASLRWYLTSEGSADFSAAR